MLIHLDTDIGGDIDDLCALVMLLRWPDVTVTGITTVAEENGRRAGYAKYVLKLAGREDIPVAAGADVSLGCYREKLGYPPDDEFWPEPVAAAPGPVDDALELLKESIERGATIVGTGPFTNFALLEQKYPGLAREATLFLMGGYVYPIPAGYPQWGHDSDYNVQVDVRSAQQVLSAYQLVLIPLTVSVQTALRRAYLPALRAAGPPGELVARQAEAHDRQYRIADTLGKSCPKLPDDIINFQHDPLACAVALGWPGVEIERLPIRLELQDGYLYERVDAHGKVMKVVTKADGDEFNEVWLRVVTGNGP
jgi:purine nucleosidase